VYLCCDLLSDFMFLSSEIVGYNDFKQLDDSDPWKDAKAYSKTCLEKIFPVFLSHFFTHLARSLKGVAMCVKNEEFFDDYITGKKVAKKFLHKKVITGK
jgi:hypothetical protein